MAQSVRIVNELDEYIGLGGSHASTMNSTTTADTDCSASFDGYLVNN